MTVKIITNIIFKFLAFFVILVMIGLVVVKTILSKKEVEGKLSTNKTRLFGLFMELDNLSILSISIVIVRFLFIVYSLIFRSELNFLQLYVLIFLSSFYGVTTKSIKNIILEVIGSVAMYIGLYASMMLGNYIHEIRFVWYIYLGNIFLIIFLVLYALYFFFKSINDVVSSSKYIRRVRNEN